MEQSEIYPIGTYVPAPYTDEERVRRINHIRDLPKMLEAAIHDLSLKHHHAMQIMRWRERNGR